MISLMRAEVTAELPPAKDEINSTTSEVPKPIKDEKPLESDNSANTTNSTSGRKTSKSKNKSQKKSSKKDHALRQSLIVDERLLAISPSHWSEKHMSESKSKLLLLQ
jgi:hypothetical protein